MNDEKNLLGLATVRRNRGISLQQISDNTKISVRCLEAIEHGEFQKLPGGIYTTSYIRQYARAIDYDEAEILAAYRGTSPGGSKVEKPRVGGLRPASGIVG